MSSPHRNQAKMHHQSHRRDRYYNDRGSTLEHMHQQKILSHEKKKHAKRRRLRLKRRS